MDQYECNLQECQACDEQFGQNNNQGDYYRLKDENESNESNIASQSHADFQNEEQSQQDSSSQNSVSQPNDSNTNTQSQKDQQQQAKKSKIETKISPKQMQIKKNAVAIFLAKFEQSLNKKQELKQIILDARELVEKEKNIRQEKNKQINEEKKKKKQNLEQQTIISNAKQTMKNKKIKKFKEKKQNLEQQTIISDATETIKNEEKKKRDIDSIKIYIKIFAKGENKELKQKWKHFLNNSYKIIKNMKQIKNDREKQKTYYKYSLCMLGELKKDYPYKGYLSQELCENSANIEEQVNEIFEKKFKKEEANWEQQQKMQEIQSQEQ